MKRTTRSRPNRNRNRKRDERRFGPKLPAVVIVALTGGGVPALAGETKTLEHRGTWINGQGGVSGMTAPLKLAISPNGRFLYVLGPMGLAELALFERNLEDGSLAFVRSYGPVDPDWNVPQPTDLRVGSDDVLVVASFAQPAAVHRFDVDPESGELTPRDVLVDPRLGTVDWVLVPEVPIVVGRTPAPDLKTLVVAFDTRSPSAGRRTGAGNPDDDLVVLDSLPIDNIDLDANRPLIVTRPPEPAGQNCLDFTLIEGVEDLDLDNPLVDHITSNRVCDLDLPVPLLIAPLKGDPVSGWTEITLVGRDGRIGVSTRPETLGQDVGLISGTIDCSFPRPSLVARYPDFPSVGPNWVFSCGDKILDVDQETLETNDEAAAAERLDLYVALTTPATFELFPDGTEALHPRGGSGPPAFDVYAPAPGDQALAWFRWTPEGGEPPLCVPTATTACASSDFAVEVSWEDFQGNTGDARVVPGGTDDSKLFYFFDPDNWEMLVKVLDACGVNGQYWLFSAATTNVGYTLRVTDRRTGARQVVSNPLGTVSPATTNTMAFPCDVSGAAAVTADRAGARAARLTEIEGARRWMERSRRLTASAGACSDSSTALCLNDSRFQVEVRWRDFSDKSGEGMVAPLRSADSGLFYFFDPANWEMLVKVLDACGVNRHFWIFAAATTNVEYTLRVTDTESGEVQEYTNPLGNASDAIIDTAAFATCN